MYDELVSYCSCRFEQGKTINLLTARCILNHKTLMLKRLAKLADKKLVNVSLPAEYKDVTELALHLVADAMYARSELLQRGILSNAKTELIIDQLQRMKRLEKSVLVCVYSDLSRGMRNVW